MSQSRSKHYMFKKLKKVHKKVKKLNANFELLNSKVTELEVKLKDVVQIESLRNEKIPLVVKIEYEDTYENIPEQIISELKAPIKAKSPFLIKIEPEDTENDIRVVPKEQITFVLKTPPVEDLVENPDSDSDTDFEDYEFEPTNITQRERDGIRNLSLLEKLNGDNKWPVVKLSKISSSEIEKYLEKPKGLTNGYSKHSSEKHKCHFCGKKWRSNCDLKRHLIVHTRTRERPYTTYTRKIIERPGPVKCKYTLERFGRIIRDKDGSLNCTICNKIFLRRDSFRAHLWSHEPQKPLKCENCSKSFLKPYELRMHNLIHTGEKPEKCEICQKKFRLKIILKSHISRVHAKEYKKQQVSTTSIKSKSHIKHLDSGMKPYQCGICKKIFSKIYHLEVHTRVHTGEKPYKCQNCDKKFSHKSALNLHMLSHTREKFKCQVCGKKFLHECRLKTHMISHTEERPYKCHVPKCQKSFTQTSSLYHHIRQFHSDQDLVQVQVHFKKPRKNFKSKENEKFKCKLCPRSFSQVGNLQRHKKNIHSNCSKRTFKCLYCPSSFTRSGDLSNHIIKDHKMFTYTKSKRLERKIKTEV